MNSNENLQLKNPEVMPTREMLENILGGSYAAYEALQDALPILEMEQEWQWYTPYKAWFARGQHFWTTKGERKKRKHFIGSMYMKGISAWRFGLRKRTVWNF